MRDSKKAPLVLLDAHTHILPDMDDGSESMEESLRLIRLLSGQGVEAICMTPHFYPGDESPERFLKRRDESANRLIRALQKSEDGAEIYFGAEVEFFEGISRVDRIDQLCIGESGILLVEMPFARWTERMLGELTELRDYREVTPLIAHIDRYLDFGNEDYIDWLIENGILIQANASFFLKGFASRKAMRMMSRRKIHFIGSDCHNLCTRRPNLREASERISAKCGETAIEYLNAMQKLIRVRGDGD